jgi:hypothetical protein
MKRNQVFLSISIILFLALYSAAKTNVSQYRMKLVQAGGIRATAPQLPPDVVKVLAGEFKGIFSDYLLMEAAAFIGGNKNPTPEDWESMALLFKQTLALDPHFKQSYYLMQNTLPWQTQKYDLTIELLGKSKNNRPWDWLPGFYIGFDYFYFLKDDLKASEHLMEASKVPGAPVLLANLAARLAQKAGRTYSAIVFLRAMYEKTDDENIKKDLETRIRALAGVLILENGIEQFTARFSRPPDILDDLVSKGILKEIPHNPYNKPYTYQNGQINF